MKKYIEKIYSNIDQVAKNLIKVQKVTSVIPY